MLRLVATDKILKRGACKEECALVCFLTDGNHKNVVRRGSLCDTVVRLEACCVKQRVYIQACRADSMEQP